MLNNKMRDPIRPVLRGAVLLLFAALLLSASAPGGAKQADRAQAQGISQPDREAGTAAADPPADSRPEGRAVRPAARRKGIHLRGPHTRRLSFKKVRHKRVHPGEDSPNKHANIALACGILCLTLANIIPLGGLICAILAIVYGSRSLREGEPNRTAATIGIVLGALFFLLMLVGITFLILILFAFA